jgi:PAS domain S-box-containing protein
LATPPQSGFAGRVRHWGEGKDWFDATPKVPENRLVPVVDETLVHRRRPDRWRVAVLTEKVEARRALAESEARFRAVFENAAVGIAHATPDGSWLRVNQALCRIVGRPADELLTKTFEDITHPDDLAAEVAQVELPRERKIESYVVDKRYLRKDGTIVWVRKTVGCVRKGRSVNRPFRRCNGRHFHAEGSRRTNSPSDA